MKTCCTFLGAYVYANGLVGLQMDLVVGSNAAPIETRVYVIEYLYIYIYTCILNIDLRTRSLTVGPSRNDAWKVTILSSSNWSLFRGELLNSGVYIFKMYIDIMTTPLKTNMEHKKWRFGR